MDFGRKILNKYGWKEGDGLGKNNDGVVKPLKASMKFDNAGLGANQAASDFNNHWWERVFNEAAHNVNVKVVESGVSMNLKNGDDSVEISTKDYSLKKLMKAKTKTNSSDSRYKNFLQAATLTKEGNEIENTDKIAYTDISVTQYKTLTDEELFRACEGRTAHKGARHGLKLNGKLSRLEQQEKELLAKMQAHNEKEITRASRLLETDKVIHKRNGTLEINMAEDVTPVVVQLDCGNNTHILENGRKVPGRGSAIIVETDRKKKNKAPQIEYTKRMSSKLDTIKYKKTKRKFDPITFDLTEVTDINARPSQRKTKN